jgi:MFS family permease
MNSMHEMPPSVKRSLGQEDEQPLSVARVVVEDSACGKSNNANFQTYISDDPHLWRHKAVYLLVCASLAAYLPYTGLLLEHAGATKQQIGSILAIRPLCALIAAPLWSRLADTGYHRSVLMWPILAAALCRYAVVHVSSVEQATLFVVLAEIFNAPTFAVVDTAIMALLSVTSSAMYYGNTRLAGSIGWAVFGPIAGKVGEVFGMKAMSFMQLLTATVATVIARDIPVKSDTQHVIGSRSRSQWRQLIQGEVLQVLAVATIIVRTTGIPLLY